MNFFFLKVVASIITAKLHANQITAATCTCSLTIPATHFSVTMFQSLQLKTLAILLNHLQISLLAMRNIPLILYQHVKQHAVY